MNYISLKHLKAIGACEDQTQKFKDTFGESVKFESLEEAQELALKYAQEFDFEWVGEEVFGKAYREAKAPLLKAYQEAIAPPWKAFEEAKAPLLKAYRGAEAPLLKACEEARVPLLEAYQEAMAPLWKAYREGCAKLFAEMWWDLPEGTKGYSKEYIRHD